MPLTFGPKVCCGLTEIFGIEDMTPKEVWNYLLDYGPDQAAIIFTQARPPGPRRKRDAYGDHLMAWLKKRNLGQVIASREAVNPNTGNLLRTYVWTPNKRARKRLGEER